MGELIAYGVRGLLVFCLWTLHSAAIAAPLNVVATTTDLKSIAEAVGGALIEVTSLAPPTANAEAFQPRPQDLLRLQRAELVIRIGLDYDLWFDPLLRKTGRAELLKNGAAHVDASQGIALLEIRSASLDSSAGHTHGAGNPHYWLDPHNVEIISANIAETLARVDAANARTYAANRVRFVAELRRRLVIWQTRLAPLAGRALLAYHDTWPYFARRFRLNIIDVIEPKPGIPPSPARLAQLVRVIRQQQVVAILAQPADALSTARFVAEKSGARVALLAAGVGTIPAARDYFAMLDHNVAVLFATVGTR